jgi:metallo-beta-lactamase family protein
MEIRFVGAIDEVTGSMTLIKTSRGNLLIDCGMFQGNTETTKKNTHTLPFVVSELKAIILTHGHLDHSGFIPKLIKGGFRGDIYCTRPTMKLANLIMRDSAKILSNENHLLHLFYELDDVIKASSFFKLKDFHQEFEVCGLKMHFNPAGHILGAASVVIHNERTIVFSGDLGRFNDPIIKAPDLCPETDVLVIESTYGARLRKGAMDLEIANFLQMVKENSKVGIIASFAVARGQLLLVMIMNYFKQYPEKKIRVVIDGPMMCEANKIYVEFADKTRCPESVKNALLDVEVIDLESKWETLKKHEGPLVIITSSGMVTGGRIWRHLKNWQQDVNALLFLPGYQAEGTAGRALAEGQLIVSNNEGDVVHWHGDIITSEAFSSHADQLELLEWMKDVKKDTTIYLNHGENEQKILFKKILEDKGYSKVKIADSKMVLEIPEVL